MIILFLCFRELRTTRISLSLSDEQVSLKLAGSHPLDVVSPILPSANSRETYLASKLGPETDCMNLHDEFRSPSGAFIYLGCDFEGVRFESFSALLVTRATVLIDLFGASGDFAGTISGRQL
jgi:hypothetical protein